jgi:hypothetical protein
MNMQLEVLLLALQWLKSTRLGGAVAKAACYEGAGQRAVYTRRAVYASIKLNM